MLTNGPNLQTIPGFHGQTDTVAVLIAAECSLSSGRFRSTAFFLLGNMVEALAMKAGAVRREHLEYEKHGSCALLAAIEPETGKRLAQVFDCRRKHEYALFL